MIKIQKGLKLFLFDFGWIKYPVLADYLVNAKYLILTDKAFNNYKADDIPPPKIFHNPTNFLQVNFLDSDNRHFKKGEF